MRIIRTTDYEQMSRAGADVITALLKRKPACTLGLATGSTPVGMYRQLISDCQKKEADFSSAVSINLDEYVGLSGDHPQSYRYFMNHTLFDHVNIRKEFTFVPDGTDGDAAHACSAYDAIIEQYGPTDLQVLGLGHDGHIGFNEPDDHFTPGTHCVALTDTTIEANKRFFASIDEVPKTAYTMGIRPIMQTGTVLLLVSGSDKAGILKQALTGPITPQVPASILQLHADLIVIGDEAALSLL